MTSTTYAGSGKHRHTICTPTRFGQTRTWYPMCIYLCNTAIGFSGSSDFIIEPDISLPPGERFHLQATAWLGSASFFAALTEEEKEEEGNECCLATGGRELSDSHKTGW